MLSNFKVVISDNLYLKDPESSEIGRKIIDKSIFLIDEIGFESFTFKKLGELIQTTESSIYRYFESKHQLLVYLTTLYWSWIEYQIVLATLNIENSKVKLEKIIKIITNNSHVLVSKQFDDQGLARIIVSEFSKTYLTKDIDKINKSGYFMVYKRVVMMLVNTIIEINPLYKYPKSLASMVIESYVHQQFLKEHLKTITNFSEANSETDFYIDLLTKVISEKANV